MILVVPQGTTDYNPETGEWGETTYPEPLSQILSISLFLCWFIIGPVCAYFGVLTRPLLMRPHNIIKWSEKKKRKDALQQQRYYQPENIRYCTNCGEKLTTGYRLCPSCGQQIDAKTQQALQAPKTVKKRSTGDALTHVIMGAFWLILGVGFTLYTMGSDSTYYVIMWGAIVFGFLEMMYGIIGYALS